MTHSTELYAYLATEHRRRRATSGRTFCSKLSGGNQVTDGENCIHRFGSYASAEKACAIDETCFDIASLPDSSFQLLRGENNTAIKTASTPRENKYRFIHITGHSTGIVTQMEEFVPSENVTKVHVPMHNDNMEITSFIFHDKAYQIDTYMGGCRISVRKFRNKVQYSAAGLLRFAIFVKLSKKYG